MNEIYRSVKTDRYLRRRGDRREGIGLQQPFLSPDIPGTVLVTKIPDGWSIADIGTDTMREFSTELKKRKPVVCNGPVGVFEIAEFANGTDTMIEVLADLEVITVIGGGSAAEAVVEMGLADKMSHVPTGGGGSAAEAVVEMGLADKMSHVPTGGGASLEFLEGKVLPGVAALQNKQKGK